MMPAMLNSTTAIAIAVALPIAVAVVHHLAMCLSKDLSYQALKTSHTIDTICVHNLID